MEKLEVDINGNGLLSAEDERVVQAAQDLRARGELDESFEYSLGIVRAKL